MKPRQHGRWEWWAAPAVVALAWLLWAATDAPPAASAAAPASAGVAGPSSAQAARAAASVASGTPGIPFSAAGLQARREQRALWQQRLERAQAALDAYRQSTRYPHESQPAGAHADQLYPNLPINEEHAFVRSDGKVAEGLRLVTTQQRVFVQGSETVRFTVSLRDGADRALPLRIVRAAAREVPAPRVAATHPDLPLDFNDEGTSGDLAAGDGVLSTQLQPATQGFAGLLGQIRVEVFLQYRDQQGGTYFDIIYSGDAPATWQGGVREALHDGSLDFLLKLDVRQPGRYVVTGRVDDADGRPFALLTFNEEVAAGAQEIKLSVFGKLVRDGKPAFPLTLRDVDAFLLRADAFPDRALVPRLSGTVHTSQGYALASFADTEWTSEERGRYLDELNRDLAQAQTKVEQLGKGP